MPNLHGFDIGKFVNIEYYGNLLKKNVSFEFVGRLEWVLSCINKSVYLIASDCTRRL